MSNKNMMFVKGMGAGVVTGMMMAAVGGAVMSRNKKGLSTKAGKTMKAVGNIAESITTMLK